MVRKFLFFQRFEKAISESLYRFIILPFILHRLSLIEEVCIGKGAVAYQDENQQ
jgi:hypothetical protein